MYTITIKDKRTYEFTEYEIKKLETLHNCLTDCDTNTMELRYYDDPKIFDMLRDILKKGKVYITYDQVDILNEYLDYYSYKKDGKAEIIISRDHFFHVDNMRFWTGNTTIYREL